MKKLNIPSLTFSKILQKIYQKFIMSAFCDLGESGEDS